MLTFQGVYTMFLHIFDVECKYEATGFETCRYNSRIFLPKEEKQMSESGIHSTETGHYSQNLGSD